MNSQNLLTVEEPENVARLSNRSHNASAGAMKEKEPLAETKSPSKRIRTANPNSLAELSLGGMNSQHAEELSKQPSRQLEEEKNSSNSIFNIDKKESLEETLTFAMFDEAELNFDEVN